MQFLREFPNVSVPVSPEAVSVSLGSVRVPLSLSVTTSGRLLPHVCVDRRPGNVVFLADLGTLFIKTSLPPSPSWSHN